METTLINQYTHFSEPFLLPAPVRPWQSCSGGHKEKLPRELFSQGRPKQSTHQALKGSCEQTGSFFLGKPNTWMFYFNIFLCFFVFPFTSQGQVLHLSCCSELSAGLSCCPKMHPMTQTGPSLLGAHPQKPPGSAHRPSAPAAGPLSGPAPGGWDPGPSASSWSQPPRPALHQLPARTGTGRGGALVSAGQQGWSTRGAGDSGNDRGTQQGQTPHPAVWGEGDTGVGLRFGGSCSWFWGKLEQPPLPTPSLCAGKGTSL